MRRHSNVCKQRGSFIVESVWVWPILLMMTLGVIQMGFLYNAKATMNNATFQAAREGSIKHGDKDAMEKRLAYAMAPLYIKKSKDIVELASKRVYLRALMSVPLASIGKVEIISPTKEIYRKFEKTQYYLDNKGREKRIKQMPNDNLNVRSVSNNPIKTASGKVKINIQDANLLKIRGHWCYEMIVPFVNYVIYQTYSALPGVKNPHWRSCRALSVFNESYYLPVSSTSVVRMQTPIRW